MIIKYIFTNCINFQTQNSFLKSIIFLLNQTVKLRSDMRVDQHKTFICQFQCMQPDFVKKTQAHRKIVGWIMFETNIERCKKKLFKKIFRKNVKYSCLLSNLSDAFVVTVHKYARCIRTYDIFNIEKCISCIRASQLYAPLTRKTIKFAAFT